MSSHGSSFVIFFSPCLKLLIFLLFTLQVSLLTDSGGTKDDLKLPTDDSLSALVNFLPFFLHLFLFHLL